MQRVSTYARACHPVVDQQKSMWEPENPAVLAKKGDILCGPISRDPLNPGI